ncbi:peptidylprolyl isomerase [Desulfuromonas sp. TF]|uniref:FKBP-type peptidyl-prolyl cis-trans isomerase n=1 Tax=Desulfuromonas sp. TF TaxID=1232410 RepID=UPI000426EECB|nr:peptidylprolyl isomerase [Desulfuromonas sp. TF]
MYYAAKGDTVKVHYTGKLSDGTLFDTSEDKAPLSFIIGKKEVIPGFEEAVVGMVTGEKKTVSIAPDKAYGESRENLVETVERGNLPSDVELKVGGQLEVTRQDGSIFHVMVTGLDKDMVILDANHPLAGKELIFDIAMLEIKKLAPK